MQRIDDCRLAYARGSDESHGLARCKPRGEPPLNWSTIVTNERPPEEYHNLDNDQPADTVKPNQQVQRLWVQDHIKWTPNLHHPNPTLRGVHTIPKEVDSTPRKPTISWSSPVLSMTEIAQKQPDDNKMINGIFGINKSTLPQVDSTPRKPTVS